MHPHGVRGRSRLALCVAASVAAAVVGPPMLGATSAGADAISAKRREAARLAARIEAQGDRLSQLDEDYNVTRLRLAKLRTALGTAEAEERRAASRLVKVQARLQRRAIASYVDPSRTSPLGRLSSGDLDADVTRSVYLGTVNGDERDALDALGAAREDLTRRRAAVDRTKGDVAAAAKRLAAQRAEAEALLARQQRLLQAVKGDLGRLLAEEQRRRADAEARRAKDELARRRAAALAELQRRRSGSSAGATASGRGSTAKDLAILAGLAPEPPASPSASRAAAVAKSLIGLPYRWGASGPGSFDCSGLVLYSYRQAGGRSLPHSSRAQYSSTTRVPVSDVRVGDLLFYGSPIHHVGIYVGGGMMVAAPRTGYNVKVSSIYRRDLVGVGRVA